MSPESEELAAPAIPLAGAPAGWIQRAKDFYLAHEPACTAGFFVAGFLFDTMFVGRIDRIHNIIHQATYLFLCAYFIGLELRETHGRFTPPERLKTVWRYHKGATHFMLGTLLNIYTLFYFKSASLSTSFLFLALLAGLLAANELKPFEQYGTHLRMGLFSLCLVSYFSYLIPLLIGHIGTVPFILALSAATGAVAVLIWRLRAHLGDQPQVIAETVTAPYGAVAMVFALLYFMRLLPPVPLSLHYIGIFHNVRRSGDQFELDMTRPAWKFWQNGDQSFAAHPGDVIHCFVSVFSPTRFKEHLQVRWEFYNARGRWESADAIPIDITGGRDGGYRGETVKSHFQPGLWRVRVQTSDQRELGRIELKVFDQAGPPPAVRTIRR